MIKVWGEEYRLDAREFTSGTGLQLTSETVMDYRSRDDFNHAMLVPSGLATGVGGEQ